MKSAQHCLNPSPPPAGNGFSIVSGLLVAAAFALMLAPHAMAEERRQPLAIKQIQYADMDMPRRGHTMSRVESEFGAPEQRRGPVGEPPISQWQYPEFKVVFEGRYVIHSVVEPQHSE
ncbi:MAG: hypothetical protein EA349_08700 [Halomonadaceae bacterium]|nr:MAG: hypothetical protein EA349_08700 [Halomonadaceae bacterium]